MNITEKNFLSELEGKNPRAIEYIVTQYGSLIKSVLFQNLYDRKEQWEECFDDVLLAIWNNPGRFEDKRGQFKNWICAIAKYKAIDTLRRESRRSDREVSYEEHLDAGLIKEAYCRERGFDSQDSSDEELDKLLACLCTEDRDLFFRRYVKEESIQQITEETGMSREMIYSRISRGKKRLRRSLKKHGGVYK